MIRYEYEYVQGRGNRGIRGVTWKFTYEVKHGIVTPRLFGKK